MTSLGPAVGVGGLRQPGRAGGQAPERLACRGSFQEVRVINNTLSLLNRMSWNAVRRVTHLLKFSCTGAAGPEHRGVPCRGVMCLCPEAWQPQASHPSLLSLSLSLFFFKFIYFERDRDRASGRGQRERERQRIPSRLRTVRRVPSGDRTHETMSS